MYDERIDKIVQENASLKWLKEIADRGIVLTGGGALLHGFEQLIEEKMGIATMTAEEPENVVAIGTGKYIDFLEEQE